jgi:Dienelactone hydrolase family
LGRSGTGARSWNGIAARFACKHDYVTDPETSPGDERRSPLDLLGVLAKADGELSETSRVVEIYTMEGLLQIWWHGDPAARDVALMCGGAMGGMLGPGRSLYLELGLELAAEGRGAMAIGYRTPGDLTRCLLDTCAAADLALRNGAERFAILGHSFGGAVAIQAASTFPAHTAGIVTYATQSAGCEDAALIGSTPLLLLHGERDSILGPENSVMVQSIAGTGEVRTFPGTDHLMVEAADEIAEITGTWVREEFAAHAAT